MSVTDFAPEGMEGMRVVVKQVGRGQVAAAAIPRHAACLHSTPKFRLESQRRSAASKLWCTGVSDVQLGRTSLGKVQQRRRARTDLEQPHVGPQRRHQRAGGVEHQRQRGGRVRRPRLDRPAAGAHRRRPLPRQAAPHDGHVRRRLLTDARAGGVTARSRSHFESPTSSTCLACRCTTVSVEACMHHSDRRNDDAMRRIWSTLCVRCLPSQAARRPPAQR